MFLKVGNNVRICTLKLLNTKYNTKTRLDEIFQIIEGLKNHPMEFNDVIIRQIIDCVIVESKEKIKVVFVGGYAVEQEL